MSLMDEVKTNDVVKVRAWLAKNKKEEIRAEINKNYSADWTPLEWVCKNSGSSEIISCLLENGADKDTCINGVTPLFLASQMGYADAVNCLLEAVVV